MIRILIVFLVFLLFLGCSQDNKNKQIVSLINTQPSVKDYKRLGDSITTIIQSALLEKINAEIKEKGEPHAIQYCSLKAIELTDSLSLRYNCLIRRVSMKNRNPANEPFDYFEKEQLEKFLLNKKKEKSLLDEVRVKENTFFYFKPIFLASESCLKCHGERGKDIDLATEIRIFKYYPKDKAIDYKVGDLRGMWSVKFLEATNP